MTHPISRWRFIVEARSDPDALVRVLMPFSLLGAELIAVTLARATEGFSIQVEAEGLDRRCAEALLRRLQALPVVRRVGFGWRAPA